MNTSPVIVRFAPSPTGSLHIGNVRTALFNYLFARHCGGKFLLRIEDTDRARSTDEAVHIIFDGLKRLGLDYDGEAVFQFARADRHREAVQSLLDAGKAYKSAASPEEIDAIKAEAREKGLKPIYPGRDGAEPPAGTPYVVRFKAPLEGITVNPDIVQGDVRIENKDLDDMILLRSDGVPTYMLSVVVDDIDMKVTHVIRGDDHLINACRQIPLFEALGATPPLYAHIPLIHGADGAKLSKRHGATTLGEWFEAGYPKEAMITYLCGLGWTFKDKEIFTLEEAVKAFDINAVNKGAARLDTEKLTHLCGVYIRAMSAEALTERYNLYRQDCGETALTEAQNSKLKIVSDLFKERAKTFKAFGEEVAFLLSDTAPAPDEKAQNLLKNEENRVNLAKIAKKFTDLPEWKSGQIGETVKNFLSENSLKMPQIGPVIRSAIAGRTNTPDIPPILEALGKDETLKRIAL